MPFITWSDGNIKATLGRSAGSQRGFRFASFTNLNDRGPVIQGVAAVLEARKPLMAVRDLTAQLFADELTFGSAK
jgi:hypothetical protein